MAWWRNSDPEPRDLSEEEFAALAGRLVDVAVRGATVTDAITATAKALGTLTGIASRRPEVSFDQMLEVASGAVEKYARTAFGEEHNEAAPPKAMRKPSTPKPKPRAPGRTIPNPRIKAASALRRQSN